MLVAAVGLSASANSQVAQPISAPPRHYNVFSIAPGGSGVGINNFGQVLVKFGDEGTGDRVSLWTPAVANSESSGNLVSVTEYLLLDVVAGGINDCGQVIFGPHYRFDNRRQPYLWSPVAPNGSTGTSVHFLDDIASVPLFWVYPETLRINNFGQISGQIYFFDPQHPTQFLWTPFHANGSSGKSNTDPRLKYIVAINDFGQAVTLHGSQFNTLFTPSSPNGASGTFTSIPGLLGAPVTTLVDINGIGMVVGWGCPNDLGVNQCRTFVWVPAARNGTSGTTIGIPIPGGFSAMVPAAINDYGDIVGVLSGLGGDKVPFLYTRGTVYDLSALSSPLVGGTPLRNQQCRPSRGEYRQRRVFGDPRRTDSSF